MSPSRFRLAGTGRPAWPLPLLVALAVLAACGTLSDLKTAKERSAAGDYGPVTRMPVSCAPRDQGCGQLRYIKADACRRMADSPRTEAAARRASLDCAVADYEAALAALAARPDPEVDPAVVTPALLDALAQRRDLATGRAEALEQNARLRERAEAATRFPGTRPAGLVFAADAELGAVLIGSDQGGCDGITRAAALLARAEARGTAVEARAQALDRALGNARRARGCRI